MLVIFPVECEVCVYFHPYKDRNSLKGNLAVTDKNNLQLDGERESIKSNDTLVNGEAGTCNLSCLYTMMSFTI